MPIRNPNVPANPPQDVPPVTPPSRPGGARRLPASSANPHEHEGADETEVGDRQGPGAGYDDEPVQDPDRGGVA